MEKLIEEKGLMIAEEDSSESDSDSDCEIDSFLVGRTVTRRLPGNEARKSLERRFVF